jgi:hypothetical protein
MNSSTIMTMKSGGAGDDVKTTGKTLKWIHEYRTVSEED